MRLAVFTICDNRQVPHARVMLDSVARFLPDAARVLVLADEPHPGVPCPPGATLVPASALDIPDFPSFAFRYDPAEFRAALKPFAFRHLDTAGHTHALFLAPDAELFNSVPALTDALADTWAGASVGTGAGGASVVLTPQILAPAEHPAPADPATTVPDDVSIMRDGVFNTGVLGIAFTAQGRDLLGWWARWLRRHCVDDRPIGLFVDQKFMDLVPGFAPGARILHDPGLNVGAWNLRQRGFVPDTAQGPQVAGGPLGIFRFAGFDDDGEAPPTLASFLAPFLAARAARVRAAGGDAGGPSNAYARFASGVPIPSVVRRMFRDDHPAWAGDPFATFEDWAHLPARTAVPGIGAAVPSLLVQWLHARTPDLAGLSLSNPADAAAVTRWWLRHDSHGLDDRVRHPLAIAAGLCPSTRHLPAADAGRPDATLAALPGDPTADEVAQAYGATLPLTLPHLARDTPGTGRLLCLCLPPSHLPAAVTALPPGDGYRVFVPCAEQPEIPNLAGVHEIWAPTRFLQAVYVLATRSPVLHMPIAWRFSLDTPGPPATRPPTILAEADGLPGDRALQAALRAYATAFPPGTRRPALVIRGTGADGWDEALRHAIAQAGATVTRPGDPDPVHGAACVLALHGGAAIGLPVARAMAHGVPVVATDAGGCTDLLTPATGWPVEAGHAPGHGMSFEPDTVHAAWLLRDLFARLQEAAARAAAARTRLDDRHAPAAVVALQAARLQALGLEPGHARAYRPLP